MKYFIPASVPAFDSLRKATRTYDEKDLLTLRPRNRTNRSCARATMAIPRAEVNQQDVESLLDDGYCTERSVDASIGPIQLIDIQTVHTSKRGKSQSTKEYQFEDSTKCIYH